jgi:hypothetical protein
MMNVILTLICHASTQAVRNAGFPMDEPLDPQGHAKASALALDMRRVDAAWTSPALRARQTAAALELNAIVDPTLRDIDFGAWSGRSLVNACNRSWTRSHVDIKRGIKLIIDSYFLMKPLHGNLLGWIKSLQRRHNVRRVQCRKQPLLRRGKCLMPESRWRITPMRL